jgi:hypothetical protein
LERLVLEQSGFGLQPFDGATLLPNSLPSLRSLCIKCKIAGGTLAGLLSAAGPSLSTIEMTQSSVVGEALGLMAAQDYRWLPALEALTLMSSSFAYPSMPRELITALARAPALKTLALRLHKYDEVVVRMLAVVEGGGLPQLTKLTLDAWHGVVSHGTRLLLALWLKQNVKEAAEGRGRAVSWVVDGIDYQYGKGTDVRKAVKGCLLQVEEARKRLLTEN